MNAEAEISKQVSINGYDLLELIGTGGFASVYKVRHRVYQRIFALKVIQLTSSSFCSVFGTYMNEVQNLRNIEHPNVIYLYNYFQSGSFLYMILEYCPNGSLMDRVLKDGPLPDIEFYDIMKQILNAIDYMHENCITHGDIKPENILFDEYGRPKIGDFGLSSVHKGNHRKHRNNLCSPAFAAPEVLMSGKVDPYKADIYSFGATMYFAALGKLPFPSETTVDELYGLVSSGIDWKSNHYLMSIIEECALCKLPEDRLTARELLNHPLIMSSKRPTIKPTRSTYQMITMKPNRAPSNISLSETSSSYNGLSMMRELSMNRFFPSRNSKRVRIITKSHEKFTFLSSADETE